MRRGRRHGRSLAAIGLLVAALSQADMAAALPSPRPAAAGVDAKAAERLMQAGRLAEARQMLETLARARPQDSELAFLRGMIAVQERNYRTAIHLFRGILVREPNAMRVRLELGRAFYLAKDYDNAERQFRFARAGDAPPAVKANIDRYLTAIRDARRLTYSFGVSVAPDTNVNAGPSIGDLDIYGLPFQLSDDARRQSGVGLVLDGAGEWSPSLGGVRLRLGGQFHVIDYRAGAFDDATLAGYAGPRFVRGQWELSPLLTGYERWYGNRFYSGGIGGDLQAAYYPAARVGFHGDIGVQQVRFGLPAGQDGPAVSGALGFFYTLGPSSRLSGSISAVRQNAQLSVFSNTAGQVGLGFYCDLPRGYSISFEPSYAQIDYDAALPAFGVARRDRRWAAELAILNRRIDVFGFTPQLSYTHTHNTSDIALYAYDRDQVQVGLTRAF